MGRNAPRGMLTILYRDEHVVAVDKPSGLLVHRSALAVGEARCVVPLLRAQLGHDVYPVHRLDRAASGVLLLASTREAAAVLGESVRRRRMRRTYLAVVRGHTAEAGTIDHLLRRVVDPAERRPMPTRRRESRPARERLEAVTDYRRLATVELPYRVDRYPTSRYSLLALAPATGRRHQIRRHLEHVSHPIVGDTTYGKARHNRLFADLFGVARLLLACVEVRVPHPARDGEVLVVTAPLAADMGRVVDALGWTPAVPAAWRGARS